MSFRQAVVIASRVVCVYFLYCAVANVINLPTHFFAVWQHWVRAQKGQSYDLFLFRYELIALCSAVLRLTMEIIFAGVFYRCGPKVGQFLAAENVG